jgi:hypothetical protein
MTSEESVSPASVLATLWLSRLETWAVIRVFGV